MVKEVYKSSEEKMNKTITVLKKELASLKAGRANPSILDKIVVPYYGTPTPISQIASIAVPEPRLLTVQPWDSSILKEIEKEILKSDLGLNPTNDGKLIRLLIPELTEETRKNLVKVIKKHGEEAKVAVRSIRREANEKIKALKKESTITEDQEKKGEEDIQKLTDNIIKEIDRIVETKEKEIMEV
ncbi:ribosome-recycling factor [Oxobacter pfennigii]|uniref:Ribosome-recycling factor n=1 Tax=Oxobacter pfennigii TaxID=36849 RepID=A0A0P8W5I0_9CLOT|nr:ribosome recycling factor [Oxobacter pfennigii]KPU43915.1 ribosome-recycling factor [Oxobacter pfennigii]